MHRREFVLGSALMAAADRKRIRIAFLGGSHPHAAQQPKTLEVRA